ncbi:GNAT family N-acetyltransferase [Pedobacter sp. MC2016-05]|uniref:GNAT family N-acetyltransferase n=1 Tax=Pedobacter sp. MC2016-05 TaxID=2994474 RepID=UPI0022476AD0|nr:GNAT family N-acetyltransferase [Pedobacter sp. MC2016-05]MCX2473940.1 GNAT family N-acetyltransferase [Pedobacter sp. MC2016-05]
MVKFILPEEVLPLRSLVLRNGKPLAECVFEGDRNYDTFHLGYVENDEIRSIASLMRNDYFPEEGEGYQLRGMATHPDFGCRGYGAALINFAVEYMKEYQTIYLWCNARSSAVTFYKKLGFINESPEFDIPGIGFHYEMRLKLK